MKTICLLLSALTCLSLTSTGSAGTIITPSASAKEPLVSYPAPGDDWRFTVGLPGWLAGMEGEIGVRGFRPVHTEMPFSEILDHLDMIGALSLEAQHGPWGFYAEGIYLKISGGGETPGRLLNTLNVELSEVIAEAEVSYRLWEGKRGYFDLFAGARYMSMDTTIHMDVSSDGIRDISQDLAGRAIDRVTDAVKGAVSEVLPEVKARVREKITSAVVGRIEDRVGEILNNYPRLPEALRLLSNADGPVSDAVRELIAAKITEGQAGLSDAAAVVSAEVAAAKARARRELSKAVQRAETKLAKRIEKAIKNTIPNTISGSKAWIDPIVGFRARYNFTDHLYAAAKADIGGFGIGSDLSWQAFGALGYQFNNHWSSELGYRYLSVDYAKDGFVYDAAMGGAFVGLKFTF